MNSLSKSFRTVCNAPKELNPQMSDLVRLGRKGDGGYLIPRQVLEEANGCLSLGLGIDWSFEKAFFELKKEKITPNGIIFFDASISVFGILKSLKYMLLRTHNEIVNKKLPSGERKYQFEDFKRTLIGLVNFFPAFKFGHNRFVHVRKFVVSKVARENEISFIDALSYRSDPLRTIVKIDIEGGEWDLLRNKQDVDLLADVPALIMEMHGTMREEFGVLVELLKYHFWIAHLHGNTSDRCTESGMPLYLEMTFVNKRFASESGIRTKLPIDGLDFPMRPGEEPYEFVFDND